MANEPKTAEQQAADERKQREAQNLSAEQQLQKQRAEQQKINEEAQKRMDEAVPTPTQEENDRFAMGIHDEDEGATAEPRKRQATAQGASAQYQTREQSTEQAQSKK